MAEIAFERVVKTYRDGTEAVCGVDLVVPDHQLLALVGPSGCGKTTMLRMVAGLEQPTDGVIRIGDRVVNDVAPKERDIAMVFQNYALYPQMSVFDNIGFGLKLRRVRKAVIKDRVQKAASVLDLVDELGKKPRHLSGGQRQRVAMGRAMVREPSAFLLDEPLSNLDAKLRVHMRAEIRSLQRQLGVTTMFVTHDQTEAMTLGDLVAVMRNGVVQQVGEPRELYYRPASTFVAGFIGSPAINLVMAEVSAESGSLFVEFGGQRLRIDDEAAGQNQALSSYVGRGIIAGVRPEHICDGALADVPTDQCFTTRVELMEAVGPDTYVHFTVDAPPAVTEDIKELAADTDAAVSAELEDRRDERKTPFVARYAARTRAREGGETQVHVDTREFLFFDPSTGAAVGSRAATAGERAERDPVGQTGAQADWVRHDLHV